jgi:hypothetical protein
MSLGEESGWVELEYGFSTITGDFIVEQKEDEENKQAVYRYH